MSRRLIRLSNLSSPNNNVFIQKCVGFFSTGPYLTLGCKIGDVLLVCRMLW